MWNCSTFLDIFRKKKLGIEMLASFSFVKWLNITQNTLEIWWNLQKMSYMKFFFWWNSPTVIILWMSVFNFYFMLGKVRFPHSGCDNKQNMNSGDFSLFLRCLPVCRNECNHLTVSKTNLLYVLTFELHGTHTFFSVFLQKRIFFAHFIHHPSMSS